MSLHGRKRRGRLRASDWAFIGLSGLVAAGLGSVALHGMEAPWLSTRGRVESAVIYEPAATALAPSQLVRVEYCYNVRGVDYRGIWDGSWPRSYSPNALANGDLPLLTTPGFPLFVWYDPGDPGRSNLHGEGTWGAALARWAVLGMALGIWLCLVRAYARSKAGPPRHSTA